MKFYFTAFFDIDTAAEEKRLRRVLEGRALNRQLRILEAFKAEDFALMFRLYEALPPSKTDHCPEKEFTGTWLSDITDALGFAKFVVERRWIA